MNYQSIVFVLLGLFSICKSEIQAGPDPWNYESVQVPDKLHEIDLPPDLRTPIKKERQTENKFGFGEWWFKRLLAIMLKSGQFKVKNTFYFKYNIFTTGLITNSIIIFPQFRLVSHALGKLNWLLL